MKIALFLSLAMAGFSVSAGAYPLDTRSMTCQEVRSVVRSSGAHGVAMYSQFGYSVVFAPRAASCRSEFRIEGAFVRTLDFPGLRRCPAGWTCVRDHDHGRR